MENSTTRPLLLSRPRRAASALLAGKPSALSLSMDLNICVRAQSPVRIDLQRVVCMEKPQGSRSHEQGRSHEHQLKDTCQGALRLGKLLSNEQIHCNLEGQWSCVYQGAFLTTCAE